MASLATRVGRNLLKLKKTDIGQGFRNVSSLKTFQSKLSKNVKNSIGCGIVVVTPITAYVIYSKLHESVEKTVMSETKESVEKTVMSETKESVEKTDMSETTNGRLQSEKLTATAKGKLEGEVQIDVGKEGLTVNLKTDLNKGTPYHYKDEEYTDDKYTFIRENGKNPEIRYLKKDNTTVIKFCLTEKN